MSPPRVFNDFDDSRTRSILWKNVNKRKDLPPHLLFQGDILEEKKDGTLILQVRRVVYSRDTKPPSDPAPRWPEPKVCFSKWRVFGCDEAGSPRFITIHKDYVLEHKQRVDANSALNQSIYAHITSPSRNAPARAHLAEIVATSAAAEAVEAAAKTAVAETVVVETTVAETAVTETAAAEKTTITRDTAHDQPTMRADANSTTFNKVINAHIASPQLTLR